MTTPRHSIEGAHFHLEDLNLEDQKKLSKAGELSSSHQDAGCYSTYGRSTPRGQTLRTEDGQILAGVFYPNEVALLPGTEEELGLLRALRSRLEGMRAQERIHQDEDGRPSKISAVDIKYHRQPTNSLLTGDSLREIEEIFQKRVEEESKNIQLPTTSKAKRDIF